MIKQFQFQKIGNAVRVEERIRNTCDFVIGRPGLFLQPMHFMSDQLPIYSTFSENYLELSKDLPAFSSTRRDQFLSLNIEGNRSLVAIRFKLSMRNTCNACLPLLLVSPASLSRTATKNIASKALRNLDLTSRGVCWCRDISSEVISEAMRGRLDERVSSETEELGTGAGRVESLLT